MDSARASLNLEQIPEFRRSMMALNTAAYRLGATLGAGLSGFVLILFSYEELGISLGALGIISALVYRLLVEDTTKAHAIP
jgi:predicted MFS family arabinose efflux permease